MGQQILEKLSAQEHQDRALLEVSPLSVASYSGLLFGIVFITMSLKCNLYFVTYVFLVLGCQALLPLWNGTWRISEPRDSQPGPFYHSHEVQASYMADFSPLYPGRQVKMSTIFSFLPVFQG